MDASLMEMRDYFGMSSKDLADSWKNLDEEERTFFKREVGAVLHPDQD